MKKSVLFPCSCFILLSIFILSSCAKEDTTPPVLTLNYGNNISQPLPVVAGTGKWIDPGYTATDNRDGNIFNSVYIFGTVDPNTKGIYTLVYSVKDAAGNVATQNRKVSIYNDADYMIGSGALFTVTDTITTPYSVITPYTVTMTPDIHIDLVHLNRFGGFAPKDTVYTNDSTLTGTINLSSHTFQISSQRVTFTQTGSVTPETHTFSGSGSIDSNLVLKTLFIHFSYSDSSASGTFTHHCQWSK